MLRSSRQRCRASAGGEGESRRGFGARARGVVSAASAMESEAGAPFGPLVPLWVPGSLAVGPATGWTLVPAALAMARDGVVAIPWAPWAEVLEGLSSRVDWILALFTSGFRAPGLAEPAPRDLAGSALAAFLVGRGPSKSGGGGGRAVAGGNGIVVAATSWGMRRLKRNSSGVVSSAVRTWGLAGLRRQELWANSRPWPTKAAARASPKGAAAGKPPRRVFNAGKDSWGRGRVMAIEVPGPVRCFPDGRPVVARHPRGRRRRESVAAPGRWPGCLGLGPA